MKVYLTTPNFRIRALAVLLSLFWVYPVAAEAEVRKFFSGPADNISHITFGPKLKRGLEGQYEVQLIPNKRDEETLTAIVRDSAVSGFVRLDVFIDFLIRNPEHSKSLEFYGDIPICLFGAVNSNTSDGLFSGDEGDPIHVDLGAEHQATAFMAKSIWPDLGNRESTTFERKGGYRALESVSQQRTDAAFFTEHPGFSSPKLSYVRKRSNLRLLNRSDVVFGSINKPAIAEKGYIPTQIELAAPGWLAVKVPIQTVCTSLGVVVNSKADNLGDQRYIEALVRSISADNLQAESIFEQFVDQASFERWADRVSDVAVSLSIFTKRQIEKSMEAIRILQSD